MHWASINVFIGNVAILLHKSTKFIIINTSDYTYHIYVLYYYFSFIFLLFFRNTIHFLPFFMNVIKNGSDKGFEKNSNLE